jgi:hypothetical protein
VDELRGIGAIVGVREPKDQQWCHETQQWVSPIWQEVAPEVRFNMFLGHHAQSQGWQSSTRSATLPAVTNALKTARTLN